MKHVIEVDEEFTISDDRFDAHSYIASRSLNAGETSRAAVSLVLRFLYVTDGPTNLPKPALILAQTFLDPAESIVARWLQTRTNGSGRASYGKNALMAARSAKYKCESCGIPDVRSLNLDHINGKHDKLAFACLCANCHAVKSRKYDWLGTPRVHVKI